MTRKKREANEKAKAAATHKRASDRERHERDAFAKKLAAAREAAQATPASGIIDDDAVDADASESASK